ncbi:MAG: hypothetical protein KatS3mg082_1760 [Nitrospiraceae bacterium]|nr:MAG: hypothetical protein KatS3mg082_1760 [Nitrospiraceae bacterium]
MPDRKFKTYLFSYRHEGATWGFEVKAQSPEDAVARVRKMANAVYDGELIMKIPAPLGLCARWLTRLRNALFRQ